MVYDDNQMRERILTLIHMECVSQLEFANKIGRIPIISNVKYNEYLKLVAQAAKIDKPISTHWARHTGATILLNEGGVDMEIVSHILGHSSTKMTRKIYAKLLDKTVVKAMTKAKKKIGK